MEAMNLGVELHWSHLPSPTYLLPAFSALSTLKCLLPASFHAPQFCTTMLSSWCLLGSSAAPLSATGLALMVACKCAMACLQHPAATVIPHRSPGLDSRRTSQRKYVAKYYPFLFDSNSVPSTATCVTGPLLINDLQCLMVASLLCLKFSQSHKLIFILLHQERKSG